MRDDVIGKEATRYGPDSGKPRREKEASQTRRGKRKKLESERYTEHDTMPPGKRTRGYVVEPARYVEGDDPNSVEIERKVYKKEAGTGRKGKAKTIRYVKGGKVRGCGKATKGVRAAKMVSMKGS